MKRINTQNNQDAFGAALMDCFTGKSTHYIIERSDGFFDPESLTMYFGEFEAWGEIEKRMPEFVRGRVLDVGCGAGRHALHLQNLGLEVVAIDRSPLAIEVAKQRGVKKAHAVSLDELVEKGTSDLGQFDSVIMMGHNIGLLHGFQEGRKILKFLHAITSADAKILGTTRAPGQTGNPDHLAYHEWNREQGRMMGQIKLRTRYRKLASDWMDYLFLSEEEFRKLLDGTGWYLETTIQGDGGFGDESYLAVLGKEK